MGTAPHRSPQRVRRRTIRHARSLYRGFIGHGKDAHGTTPIAAQGSPASDPTRPIPAEGSPASSRIRTAPQRERSDTPDPCRRFMGHGKDSHGHGTTARALRHARSLLRVHRSTAGWARHHSESAPTRPIPVEGSSVHGRMGTAPQRERSDTPDPCRGFIGPRQDGRGTTARALRHARSL